MAKYKVGDIAYLLESNRFIREGKIARYLGGLYLFHFIEGGAIQVKEHRLFPSEEAAQAEMDRIKKEGRKMEDRYIFDYINSELKFAGHHGWNIMNAYV